ncbi:Putative protease AXL1 [Gossypium arboreum]|uniref:Putative protease AXL1 n=1 Tax=Gossypium arboreum TaxID=29729 RepID=A0A0B0N8U5_GOSAR|nr:Putative protease AXL1 [Gossypium arboreum]
MVLLAHIYQNHISMPWSYSHTYIGILCHDICILTLPKVYTGFSDVITRLKRIQKCSSQAYSYSAIACINSYISYQHVYLTFNYNLTRLFAYKLASDDIKRNRPTSRRLSFSLIQIRFLWFLI